MDVAKQTPFGSDDILGEQAYAATDAAVAEQVASTQVENLLQSEFGVLRNALSLLLMLADERESAQLEASAAEREKPEDDKTAPAKD